MTDKIRMVVEMEVTVPQALALEAMFNHWNTLGAWGASRNVGFFVDGDGNFQPNIDIKYSEEIPQLTPTMEALSRGQKDVLDDDVLYDFDPIAWHLRELGED